MKLSDAIQARSLAALVILGRIQRDLSTASVDSRRVLELLRLHALDEGYGLRDIEEDLGGSANRLLAVFASELRCSVEVYLGDLRLGAGFHLLVATHLSIGEISRILGYAQPSVFRTSFKRRSGMSPAAFRKDNVVRQAKRNLEPLSSAARSRIARQLARELWSYVSSEWAGLEEKIVEWDFFFAHPGLFDFLSEKSRIEGRQNRRFGAHLAELALRAVERSALLLGERYKELRALALARWGNACVLAFDFMAAEAAFREAEKVLPPHAAPEIEAEIWALRGTMHTFRRRFEEGLRDLQRALTIARESDHVELQVDILVQRAAIRWCRVEPEKMIPDLEIAKRLLEDRLSSDVERYCYVQHQLVLALCETERFAEAAALLPQARQLAEKMDQPMVRAQLQWIEGMIETSRGALDRSAGLILCAQSAFLEMGDFDTAALASLDLAVLYERQGRSKEAQVMLTQVIEALEAISLEGEALAALESLRRIARVDTELSIPKLQKARGSFRKIFIRSGV